GVDATRGAVAVPPRCTGATGSSFRRKRSRKPMCSDRTLVRTGRWPAPQHVSERAVTKDDEGGSGNIRRALLVTSVVSASSSVARVSNTYPRDGIEGPPWPLTRPNALARLGLQSPLAGF